MRYALMSMNTYSSPPVAYGGEIFCWHLARGLHELGAHVTLVGAPGSLPPDPDCTECRLRYQRGAYGKSGLNQEFEAANMFYAELLENHDVVLDFGHNKFLSERAAWWGTPEEQAKIRVVPNGAVSAYPRCGPYNVVAGSQVWRNMLIYGRNEYYGTPWAAQYGDSIVPLPAENILGVVPWATDASFYTPGGPEVDGAGDYLLWLSHPAPYKGLPQALEVARRTKLKLVVCPGIGVDSHRADWEAVAPIIAAAVQQGAVVEVARLPIDSRTHALKRDLYRRARALIFPVQRHEAFGLVVAEAMACGTPAIVTPFGAMPELVTSGENGFICHDLQELCDAAMAATDLSRAATRDRAARDFHYTRAARDFLALEDHVVPPTPHPAPASGDRPPTLTLNRVTEIPV